VAVVTIVVCVFSVATSPRTPNGVATALLSGITISCTQLNTRFV
jgi:hypothetical protein